MYHRAVFLVAILVTPVVILTSCAKKKHAAVIAPAATPSSASAASTGSEVGIASWYGHPYHGRQAANGEIYDMEKMTAAHRTLPFNTWVRVTNLTNNKTTEVRITDRGPFIDGRIIDLSHAAAREIELIGPGVARVRVDIISRPTTVPAAPTPPVEVASLFAVQVGAFEDRERAERLGGRLRTEYGASTHVVWRDGRPATWRVLIGAEGTVEGANALAQKLQAEIGTAYVVRLDVPGAAASSGTR
jgi:rare lipoprotein A